MAKNGEKMKPKISFLMATKNRAFIIKDTLNSLLSQEIKEWEAVIVDDHGQDETSEIIKSFNDQRFRYFKLGDAHGHGTSCARNFGALLTKAEIIAIQDDDDISYPNRVTFTLDAFKKHPEIDIFYGNMDIWEEETGIVRDRKTPVYPYSFERMKDFHFIPQNTVALKRQLLLDNPYNQFFKFAEDYELLSRLAQQGKKFFYNNTKIVKYRAGSANMSTGPDKKELVSNYGLLVKMVRGWIPFDEKLLSKIEEMEK